MRDKTILLGVTGSMGCGKTYTCGKLMIMAKATGINICYISVDDIRRDILGTNELYENVRNQIINSLGKTILNKNGTINRSELGKVIFNNSQKMNSFKKIISPFIKEKIKNDIKNKDGLILVEWALLLEDNLLPLVNNNVLLVTCDEKKQMERLKDGDLPKKQVIKRINYGLSNEKKLEKLKQMKANSYIFDTTEDPTIESYKELLNKIIK